VVSRQWVNESDTDHGLLTTEPLTNFENLYAVA